MITFHAGSLAGRVALIAALLTVAACSREQQDWRSAEAANTIEAYQRFIEQHADSELAAQAHARVAEFAEDRDWQQAGKVGTAGAYREFLAQHPAGKWSQEARIRVESFGLGSIPRIDRQTPAEATSRPSGVRLLQLASAAPAAAGGAPPATEPQQHPGPQSVPANPAPNGYAVQLGAFGTQAGADREWQRLQTRFGAQLSGLSPRVVAADTASGPLYRLQAPARGEAQARAICDSLKQQSQACVPVAPH